MFEIQPFRKRFCVQYLVLTMLFTCVSMPS